MKITLSWLKDYLETDASLSEIADRLSMIGLVIDGINNPAEKLAPFKIAKVVEAKQHPNADRLQVCKVDTGTEVVQVVCADPNAATGMKAVFAGVGAVIPSSGIKLKATEIRGVKSVGMLCSAKELNLSEESVGIIEVEGDAPIGENYAKFKGLDDPVLDIEITPNRGDCLGAYGIARDLAATGIGKLKPLVIDPVPNQFESDIEITIDSAAKEACPMFAGRLIKSVKNGPSPEWMQTRLRAIGLRPISALVDITNYLSYNFGRPMHVFDADKINHHLQIRPSKAGEKIKALDDKEYTLTDGMTVVADKTGPHSVAGVIGGEASGCTDATTNVLVESAVFDPIRTALTGRKLNVITDSRYRFERGVDAAMVIPAIEFATRFIIEHCGGSPGETVIAGKEPATHSPIAFNPTSVKHLIGIHLSKLQIENILTDLGFKVGKNGEAWSVSVPSWRHDIKQEADLIEEVVRIHGYDNIEPISLPAPRTHSFDTDSKPIAHNRWIWSVRRDLAHRGLSEAMTNSFHSKKLASLFGGGKSELALANPISADLSDMRPSLLPNLVEACRRNYDRGITEGALFEVGPQFSDPSPQGEILAVAGVRTGHKASRHWLTDLRKIDTFDAKADAFAVLATCGLDPSSVQIVATAPDWYHPGRSGTLQLGPKNILGHFGELHPSILNKMDLDKTTVGFEIFLSNLPVARKKARPPLELSPYQPLERDFAFVIEESIAASEVISAVYKADRELVAKVEVFDLYQGPGIASGYKSLAIAVRLEPKKATLTEAEITAVSDKIIEQVKKSTNAALRSV